MTHFPTTWHSHGDLTLGRESGRRDEQFLPSRRPQAVRPLGEVARVERCRRDVPGVVESGLERRRHHFVRRVEADEGRSRRSGALLCRFEPGPEDIVDEFGRQQERRGERRAGGNLIPEGISSGPCSRSRVTGARVKRAVIERCAIRVDSSAQVSARPTSPRRTPTRRRDWTWTRRE